MIPSGPLYSSKAKGEADDEDNHECPRLPCRHLSSITKDASAMFSPTSSLKQDPTQREMAAKLVLEADYSDKNRVHLYNKDREVENVDDHSQGRGTFVGSEEDASEDRSAFTASEDRSALNVDASEDRSALTVDASPKEDEKASKICETKGASAARPEGRRRPFPQRQTRPGAFPQWGPDHNETSEIGTVVVESSPCRETADFVPPPILHASLVPGNNDGNSGSPRRPEQEGMILVDAAPVPEKEKWKIIARQLLILVFLVGVAVGIALGVISRQGSSRDSPQSVEVASDQWSQAGQDVKGEVNDLLGFSLSLSQDGKTMAMGALEADHETLEVYDVGYVKVVRYEEDGEPRWEPVGADIAGNEGGSLFGFAVDLSQDGSVLAISSASWYSFVQVYEFLGGEWQPKGPPITGDPWSSFGWSLSLSADGDALAVGAPYHLGSGIGYVRMFRYSAIEDDWVQVGSDMVGEAPGSRFGFSVSLSSNAERIAIGSPLSDTENGEFSGLVSVYALDYSMGENRADWIQVGPSIKGTGDSDGFGWSVSLVDSSLAIGAPQQVSDTFLTWEFPPGARPGYAQVYHFHEGELEWKPRGPIVAGKASLNRFGFSVALSSDGGTLVAGSVDNVEGLSTAGYMQILKFDEDHDYWEVAADIGGDSNGDRFGFSVAVSADGSTAAGGALFNAENGSKSGHARAFRRSSG